MMRCCLATEMCSEKCCIIVQTQCVLPQNNMGVMSLVDKNLIGPLLHVTCDHSLYSESLLYLGSRNFRFVLFFWPGTVIFLPQLC